MTFDKKDKIEIVEDAFSWVVVLAMFIYGGGKILQFNDVGEIKKSISELKGMELMWAFYGYSKSYAIILGLFEIVGGLLMLIKKTRLIGCFFISTILVNIILQDIFYGVYIGALKAAIFYQFLILIILWINKTKVILSMKALLNFDQQQPCNKIIIKLLVAFVFFILLRIAEFYITIVL